MSTTLKRITILILASFGISILAVLLRASYFTITFQVLIFAVAFIWLFAWLVYSADSTGRSLLWTGVAFVLFVPYLLATAAGAAGTCYVVVGPLLKRQEADAWVETPCVIRESGLEESTSERMLAGNTD